MFLYNGENGLLYGTSGFDENEFNGRDEIRGSVTHYVDEFLGASHDLKMGFEYNDTWAMWDSRYTGGDSGHPGWIGIYPYGYYGSVYVYGFTYDSHITEQLRRPGGFIQDDLRVSSRVNLNLGLRLDNPRVSDGYAKRIGTGNEVELQSFSNWAPRIGGSFDLTGSGQAVAHASWGRYYEKINAWGLVGFSGDGIEDTDFYFSYLAEPFDFDAYSTEDLFALYDSVFTDDNLLFSFAYDRYGIDPNLGSLHTDVFNAGVEVELSGNYSIGLDYVHKDDSQFIIWDDLVDRTFTPFEYTSVTVPGFLETPTTQTLYSCDDCSSVEYFITNDEYYDRKHDLLMLSLQKRPGSNFNFNTSLTWQRSRGTMDNLDGALWGTAGRGFHENPNYNGHPFRGGSVSFLRKLNFKLLSNYRLPWGGLLAGAYWNVASGRPWAINIRSRMLPQNLNDGRTFILPIEPIGSRTWEMLNRIDLRLQKSFDLATNGRLEIILDAFNITNDDSPQYINQDLGQSYPLAGTSSLGKPRDPANVMAPRQIRLGGRLVF